MATRKNQPHRKLRRLETALYNWRIRDEREKDAAYVALKYAHRAAIESGIARLKPLARSA